MITTRRAVPAVPMLATPALVHPALAQERPVRFIVPFPPPAARPTWWGASRPRPRRRRASWPWGAEPIASTPEAFSRFVRAEFERFGQLIRDADIKGE